MTSYSVNQRQYYAFISHAEVEVSLENLNTCIETGMARGANVPLHLIARTPRQRPSLTFRDQQVWYYEGDIELLGKIHTIVYPYRRRILNYELSELP